MLCAWAALALALAAGTAAAEGRMSAGAARRVDQAAHRGRTGRAAAGGGRADRGGGRRRGQRGQLPGAGLPVDPAKVSLTGIYLGQAVVAIIAVTAVSGEYSTGMMRLTLAATPRRWRVLAAKAAVVGAATLVAGAVAVLASVLAGGVLLARHGIDPAHGYEALSLGHGAVLRAAAGSVLYLGLIALLGLGVAAMIRDSAVAIGTVLGLLYLFPIVASFVGNPDLAAAPGTGQPDDGRAVHPGHHEPERAAAHPLAGPRGAGRLGGRRAAGRRPAAALPRRVTSSAHDEPGRRPDDRGERHFPVRRGARRGHPGPDAARLAGLGPAVAASGAGAGRTGATGSSRPTCAASGAPSSPPRCGPTACGTWSATSPGCSTPWACPPPTWSATTGAGRWPGSPRSCVPDRVRTLTVISSPHPLVPTTVRQQEKAWYQLFFQFYGVAEATIQHDDWAWLRMLTRGDGDLGQAIENLSRPGALTASLNWYRANLAPRMPGPGPRAAAGRRADAGHLVDRGSLPRRRADEELGGFVQGPWRYEEIPGASHWVPLDAPDAAERPAARLAVMKTRIACPGERDPFSRSPPLMA